MSVTWEEKAAASANLAHVIGLRQHLDRRARSDVLPEHWYEAEEEVRCDPDTYSEWIAVECARCQPIQLGYIPTHDIAELTEWIAAKTVPELVTVTRTPFNLARVMALDELEKRFARQASTERRILRRAQEIAGEAE